MSRQRAWSILLLGLATACTGGGSPAPAPPSASASGSVDPAVYAVIQLRPVDQVLTPSSPEWGANPPSCPLGGDDAMTCLASPDNAERIVLAGPVGSQERYVLGEVIVDGSDVSGTTGHLQGSAGEVSVSLSPHGSDALVEATRAVAGTNSPGNQIAIVVQGRVHSAPIVQVPITSGQVVVSGLTRMAARLLLIQLASLPQAEGFD